MKDPQAFQAGERFVGSLTGLLCLAAIVGGCVGIIGTTLGLWIAGRLR